jgi:hypothetical protein
MGVTLPLFTEPNGIVRTWTDNGDGTYTIHSSQEIESDILDQNKAMANHNDGYTPSRDVRRVARLPQLLMEHWKYVEGWDPLHPSNAKKLARILNDREWMWLRTAPGKL